MNKLFKKSLSLISFIFIPIAFLWNPNWLGFLGSQPYWPLLWLLPWSMTYGSINGLIVGLFLGLTLDSLTLDSGLTQIPGLILCSVWFGQLKTISNFWVGYFRYGLICSIGCFCCGVLYFVQVLIKNLPDSNFFLFFNSIENILSQVFITGLFAPLVCSNLFTLFKSAKEKNVLINYTKK